MLIDCKSFIRKYKKYDWKTFSFRHIIKLSLYYSMITTKLCLIVESELNSWKWRNKNEMKNKWKMFKVKAISGSWNLIIKSCMYIWENKVLVNVISTSYLYINIIIIKKVQRVVRIITSDFLFIYVISSTKHHHV